MAWNGSSQVMNGIGRLPCLMCVKRSSSAAARTRPSFTRQAAGSWNVALMPSVYMKLSFQLAGEGVPQAQEIAGGTDHDFRRNAAQAVVMPFRADALVAVLAGNIVIEDPARDSPGRVLRVRQGIEV